MDWKAPFDQGKGALRRGRGIAIGFKACVSPTTSLAAVNVNGDGSCIVYCSTVDMGQGSDTAMAQIAGEVLNLPAEAVRVVHSDTDVTPYDMATLGSRSLFHMGNAVKLAAEDARNKLAAMREELKLPADAQIADIFRRKYGMQAGNVVGAGSFVPSYAPPDHATGLTSNPASLAEYKIPGFLDVPEEIINEAVSAEQRSGPFGAKGVGETGTFGVSPAIANALQDAVGVRLTSLPLNPEAVYQALAR